MCGVVNNPQFASADGSVQGWRDVILTRNRETLKQLVSVGIKSGREPTTPTRIIGAWC